jgi:uncharacterized protein (DUF2384 family)
MARYRQLIAHAVDAFGDEKIASRWLSLPSHDFGGCTPLEVAQRSGYDPESLEPALLRIAH